MQYWRAAVICLFLKPSARSVVRLVAKLARLYARGSWVTLGRFISFGRSEEVDVEEKEKERPTEDEESVEER